MKSDIQNVIRRVAERVKRIKQVLLKIIYENKNAGRFLVVGAASTLIDMGIYFFLFDYCGAVWSKLVSMSCSICFSYNLNRSWSFQVRDKQSLKEFFTYLAAQTLNIMVNVGTNYLVLSLSNSKIVAYILATAAGMAVNYILQKVWVFRRK